jgi:hypothetical protein
MFKTKEFWFKAVIALVIMATVAGSAVQISASNLPVVEPKTVEVVKVVTKEVQVPGPTQIVYVEVTPVPEETTVVEPTPTPTYNPNAGCQLATIIKDKQATYHLVGYNKNGYSIFDVWSMVERLVFKQGEKLMVKDGSPIRGDGLIFWYQLCSMPTHYIPAKAVNLPNVGWLVSS